MIMRTKWRLTVCCAIICLLDLIDLMGDNVDLWTSKYLSATVVIRHRSVMSAPFDDMHVRHRTRGKLRSVIALAISAAPYFNVENYID